MFLYLAFHVFGVVGPHEQGAEAKLLAAHETVLQRPYQLTIPKYLSNKARAEYVSATKILFFQSFANFPLFHSHTAKFLANSTDDYS